jgi:hypothetical protein
LLPPGVESRVGFRESCPGPAANVPLLLLKPRPDRAGFATLLHFDTIDLDRSLQPSSRSGLITAFRIYQINHFLSPNIATVSLPPATQPPRLPLYDYWKE